jgi:hypothetical protein
LKRREVLNSFGQKTRRKKTTGMMLWRWKYNSEAHFQEIGWEDVESIYFPPKRHMCQAVLKKY